MSLDISERMIAHAQREDPYECCGLLAGKNGIATEIYPITNLPSDDPLVQNLDLPADRTLRYFMNPKEQFAAYKKMRENGTEELAVYHSHTHSPAYPSPTDVRLARCPDMYYLIVSLQDKKSPHIRAFRIIADRTLRNVMDPKEQTTAFKQMRENDTELVEIYHSHTHSPAYPSETDIRPAFYPDVHYLIVSLEDKKNRQIPAFRFVEGKIHEEEILLVAPQKNRTG